MDPLQLQKQKEFEVLNSLIQLIQIVSSKVYDSKVFPEIVGEAILRREIDKLEYKVEIQERKINKLMEDIEKIKNRE